MKFTVLGSKGFVGGKMVLHLRNLGFQVETPSREVADLRGRPLGHVIYAIGLTGNFRKQPRAAIDAHVNVLQRLIEGAEFDSWLYLSSARIYGGMGKDNQAVEDAPLCVRPGLDAIYDLSKLLGESVCMSHGSGAVRIARLSNVYGAGQSQHVFLGSIIRDLVRDGRVVIGESPQSSKDYVSVDDVVEALRLIATEGRENLYNVASGRPVTHQELADKMRGCGYCVEFAPGAATRIFPVIATSRVSGEFGGTPRSILDDLPLLIQQERNVYDNSQANTRK